MQFFLPNAKDDAQAESVYAVIREHLSEELGADCSTTRFRVLDYVHEGKNYHAEVGQNHSLNQEPVIAIVYESLRRIFHICTTNRGVARGGSILVGEANTRHMEEFD